MHPDRSTPPLAALLARAARLTHGPRRLLGIVGPPGAGKSTLSVALVEGLAGRAVLVPMDGFHLDDAVLADLGRSERKGAPDTFDAAGYVHLLRRLRAQDDVVYAPVFRREQEQAVAGALSVPPGVPLVVTEGNYLLGDGAFRAVRDLLDETWFLELDPGLRRRRLVARHVRNGRTPRAAERWVAASDDRNAALVDATRGRADLVVQLAAG